MGQEGFYVTDFGVRFSNDCAYNHNIFCRIETNNNFCPFYEYIIKGGLNSGL